MRDSEYNANLYMSGEKIVELGCAGHFICARDCHFRRHTQIGDKYRVSTVGDYYPPHKRNYRESFGLDGESYFETMVFATTPELHDGNEGCGCHEVVSYSEIDAERYATAGEAQAGHARYVAKYAAKAAK